MQHDTTSQTVRPGEGRRVLLCLGLSFCLGVVEVLLYAASRAVFLSRYSSGDLPLVYVGVALAVTACSLSFGLLQRRVDNGPLLLSLLTALAASLAGFRLWLDAGGGATAAMLLAIWFDVVFILGSLAFWGLAGALFDVRQARRLYGLIGSGEYLATLLAGLASPWLAERFGAANLLWPAAGALCAGLILGAALVREAGRTAHRRETGPDGLEAETAPAAPGVRSYLTGMHLVWALSVCGLFLTDLVLNTQAETHAAGAVAMAAFFGRFYAVAGALVLLARLTVSGRTLVRLGPVSTLVLLPSALALMATALISGASMLTEAAPLIFWLAVGCRLLDYVLRYSFHKPAFMVLYQPLGARRRVAAQATVEGLAEPAAILAVGLLLLAGRRAFSLDVVHVSWLLLGVLAAWFAALALVRARYRDVLMAALRRGRSGAADISLADPRARRALLRKLAGPDPADAIAAMDLLDRHAPDELGRALPDLLARPEPEVLLAALERLARWDESHGVPAPAAVSDTVRSMAGSHAEPAVRGAALAALPALAEAGPSRHEAAALLRPALDDTETAVRLGAAAGLGRLGRTTVEAARALGERLESMAASPEADTRAEAARMAGAAGRAGAGDMSGRILSRLLEDAQPEVARTALNACGETTCHGDRSSGQVGTLLAMAARRGMRAPAVRALAASGPAVLPALERAVDDESRDRRERLAAVRAMARMGGDALASLASRLDMADGELRGAMLEGLADAGWRAPQSMAKELARAMRREADLAAWCLECRQAVALGPACAPLASALADEADAAGRRLLRLLALERPSGALDRARRRLAHPDPAQRALALEMLENLLPPGGKRFMLPLLSPDAPGERLAALRSALGRAAEPGEGWLAAAVAGHGGLLPWTRAAALHCLATARPSGPRAEAAMVAARAAAAEPDPLVAETAAHALQPRT